MKANNVPDKLYLSKTIYSTFLYQVPDPDDETAVEYIRTDAFIEKACDFIETYPHLFMGVLRSEVIKDFKNHMKGE